MNTLSPETDDEVFRSRELLLGEVKSAAKRKRYPYIAISKRESNHSYFINIAALEDRTARAIAVEGNAQDDLQRRHEELVAELERVKQESDARRERLEAARKDAETVEVDRTSQRKELQASLSEVEARRKELEDRVNTGTQQAVRLEAERDIQAKDINEARAAEKQKDDDIAKLKQELAVRTKDLYDSKARETQQDEEITLLKKERTLYTPKYNVMPKALMASFSNLDDKWPQFYLTQWIGNGDLSKGPQTCFNDLDQLDSSWRPKSIALSFYSNTIDGLSTEYGNEKNIKHGENGGSNETFRFGGSIVAVRAESRIVPPSHTAITDLYFKTADGAEQGRTSAKKDGPLIQECTFVAQPGYSLRGFYGQYGWAFERFGLIWGKD